MPVEREVMIGRVFLGHDELPAAAVAIALFRRAEPKVREREVRQDRLQSLG